MILSLFLIVNALPASASNTLTFQFDNADNPDVDFVGLQFATIDVQFSETGPGLFNAGESFILAGGNSLGANDLFETPLNGPLDFDTNGILFFGLNVNGPAIPLSDTFFVTLTVFGGTVNVTDITASFFLDPENGVPANGVFQGSPIRNINAVPEPATWLMMIFGFAFVGLATRRRKAQHHSYT